MHVNLLVRGKKLPHNSQRLCAVQEVSKRGLKSHSMGKDKISTSPGECK